MDLLAAEEFAFPFFERQIATMGKKSEKSKPSRQKPPPIDQYIIPIIVLGVAMLGYQFYKGMNSEVSCFVAAIKK